MKEIWNKLKKTLLEFFLGKKTEVSLSFNEPKTEPEERRIVFSLKINPFENTRKRTNIFLCQEIKLGKAYGEKIFAEISNHIVKGFFTSHNQIHIETSDKKVLKVEKNPQGYDTFYFSSSGEQITPIFPLKSIKIGEEESLKIYSKFMKTSWPEDKNTLCLLWEIPFKHDFTINLKKFEKGNLSYQELLVYFLNTLEKKISIKTLRNPYLKKVSLAGAQEAEFWSDFLVKLKKACFYSVEEPFLEKN